MVTFKITEGQEERLLEALKSGSDLMTSAYYAKIDVDEFLSLLEEESSSKKTLRQKEAARLLVEIKGAKAHAILNAQAKITSYMKEDWRAAAWWLERTLPEVYGKKGGGN